MVSTRRIRRAATLVAAMMLLATPCFATAAPPLSADPFLQKPYLQLGPAFRAPRNQGDRARLTLLWHTGDADAVWTVETRPAGGRTYQPVPPPQMRRVAVEGVPAQRVWSADLDGLTPGAEYDYRVLHNGKAAFSARFRAPHAPGQSYRFVVFGDCAAGTEGQRAVAYQTYREKPDFVFITGDIVYSRGRVSEYTQKYFPVYNADDAAPGSGAPLTRSRLFVAAPGNHDIGNRDLDTYPDGLAYFFFWAQPLNGPLTDIGAPGTPILSGARANQQAFLRAAGTAYPRMANFSFDYGNAHWLVLDANDYVDWTDPALRAWVEKDLAAAKDASWRFVGFHHPGFNSSTSHFNAQQTRLLSDLFERGRVDLVFAGHVHNYQRTFPLRFAPRKSENGKWRADNGRVAGDWTLDKRFDGEKNTRPDGVIYLVTGAGGAGLYTPEQQNKPETWQPFTMKFIADTHSLTVVDVRDRKLTVRQVAKDGREIDRFVVEK